MEQEREEESCRPKESAKREEAEAATEGERQREGGTDGERERAQSAVHACVCVFVAHAAFFK